MIVELTENKVKCLLSNSSTDFIKSIYGNEFQEIFRITIVDAKRMINSNAEGRGAVQEVIIRNW